MSEQDKGFVVNAGASDLTPGKWYREHTAEQLVAEHTRRRLAVPLGAHNDAQALANSLNEDDKKQYDVVQQHRAALRVDPAALPLIQEVMEFEFPSVEEKPIRTCGKAIISGVCGVVAEEYDKDPYIEQWYCREHRRWSWYGTWEDVGWSLKLTPRLTEDQWALVNQDVDSTYNPAIGGWDINLLLRLIRRVLPHKNVEIVLPPPPPKKKRVRLC